MIYTVTTNPCIDYYMDLTAPLRVGEINRAAREECRPGGKGVNVAILLSRLGADACALGFCAGASGGMLRTLLAGAGCRSDLTELTGGMTRINVKILGDPETACNGSGPAVDGAALERLVRKLERLTSRDTLVLSGNLQPSIADAYARLARCAAVSGARLAVDTTGAALLGTLEYRPYFIKPNLDELGELFSCRVESRAHALELARRLQAGGAQNVLVSMGAEGALLLAQNGAAYHAVCSARGEVVSTVGAGDSLVAGFLSQETGGEAALRMGVACGSATALAGRLATADQAARCLEQTRSEQIDL